MLSCRPILARPVPLLDQCIPHRFYERETGFSNYGPKYLVTMCWPMHLTALVFRAPLLYAVLTPIFIHRAPLPSPRPGRLINWLTSRHRRLLRSYTHRAQQTSA
jgi:hypothetical protein